LQFTLYPVKKEGRGTGNNVISLVKSGKLPGKTCSVNYPMLPAGFMGEPVYPGNWVKTKITLTVILVQ
jgi:hypothetical protein